MVTTNKLLNLDEVFKLSWPLGPRHTGYWLQVRSGVEFNRRWTEYIRGERVPRKSIQLQIAMGQKFTDVLGNSCSLLVASQQLVDALDDGGCSGWRSFPIEIFAKTGKAVREVYFGIGIRGRAGNLNYDRSGVEGFEGENGAFIITRMKRYWFDPKTWDGSDFFMLKDRNDILVTPRVVNLLRKMKATGWEATPVLKFKLGKR